MTKVIVIKEEKLKQFASYSFDVKAIVVSYDELIKNAQTISTDETIEERARIKYHVHEFYQKKAYSEGAHDQQLIDEIKMGELLEWCLNVGYNHIHNHNVSIHAVYSKRITTSELIELAKKEIKSK